jgi:FtsZ-interacting cell division protein ZipA
MNQLETLKVKGISFFMSLPLKTNEINAFDEMMSILKRIKSSLKGELLDDTGSSLSIQRERYIREEVIEYSLKNQKNNHI